MPYLLADSQLTREQRAVVELRPDRHHLVLGPPGSGKTQVLLHRARWLRDRMHVGADQYRIFVFTNVLSQFIRQSLELLRIPKTNVQPFDEWCGSLWTDYVGEKRPSITVGKRTTIDYAAVRSRIADELAAQPPTQCLLAFALVDEGQDLNHDAYAILRATAGHISVFADARQQIFEGGLGDTGVLRELGLPQTSAAFLPAYRNSPDVARLAGYFGAQFEGQNFAAKEREKPLLYIASDWDDEVDQIARVLRERMHLKQRTCVIVPTNRDLYGLANRLQERGVTIEKAVPPRRGEATADFESMIPKIATYHSAKGLTFDCTVLPRLVELNFKRVEGERRARLLLVGITRAMRWVHLSTVRNYELKEISVLRTAAARGDLFVRESTPKAHPASNVETQSEDDAFL